MELKIKPFHKNSYKRACVLIKGADAAVWLQEIYKMGLDPEDTVVYALPGIKANEIFGCLVILKGGAKVTDVGRNSYMQCVNHKLFIPENTIVFPELSDAEWAKLFTAPAYVMHQDIGFAELTDEIDWDLLIQMPGEAQSEITVPSKSVYIPNSIRSISIEADEEKLAEEVENQVGSPDAKDMPFNMDKIMKGNQREIDKLLKYLEKHPEAALTLGIPLDVMGSSRGGGGARFVFGKNGGSIFNPDRGTLALIYILVGVIALVFIIAFFMGKGGGTSSFPLIIIFFIGRFLYTFFKDSDSNRYNSGGAATIADDKFAALQAKYEKLAQDYIAQKEYHKAAGIYLKLLKNNFRAAQVLEEGGYYGEAGAIYLKHCKDKSRAAQCFEKARLYGQAIEIYKELGENEKVGDLYVLLNQEKEAERYYEMVAEDYVKHNQFVKASLIYRKKMKQPLGAQDLLLQGWHKNFDANNCLNNYFANIENTDVLIAEIKRFYKVELEDKRKEAFLQVIKTEFYKHESLQKPVKEIAYEIIAEAIETSPFLASELVNFNPKDRSLTKDIMKFKSSKMNKK